MTYHVPINIPGTEVSTFGVFQTLPTNAFCNQNSANTVLIQRESIFSALGLDSGRSAVAAVTGNGWTAWEKKGQGFQAECSHAAPRSLCWVLGHQQGP